MSVSNFIATIGQLIFTAVWSGDVSNSCENDSNARNIPQIDSDSMYARVFFTLNLSVK